MYASLDRAAETNEYKILTQIAAPEEGEDLTLLLRVKDADGESQPYLVLLHMILTGPRGDGVEQDIYAWVSDTTAGQVPVSARVKNSWLSVASDLTEVNKPSTMLLRLLGGSLSTPMLKLRE